MTTVFVAVCPATMTTLSIVGNTAPIWPVGAAAGDPMPPGGITITMYVPAGSSAASAPDGDIVNMAVCPVDMFVAMTVHLAHTSSAPESTVSSRRPDGSPPAPADAIAGSPNARA